MESISLLDHKHKKLVVVMVMVTLFIHGKSFSKDYKELYN